MSPSPSRSPARPHLGFPRGILYLSLERTRGARNRCQILGSEPPPMGRGRRQGEAVNAGDRNQKQVPGRYLAQCPRRCVLCDPGWCVETHRRRRLASRIHGMTAHTHVLTVTYDMYARACPMALPFSLRANSSSAWPPCLRTYVLHASCMTICQQCILILPLMPR